MYLGRGGGLASHTVELAEELQHQCDLTCYFAQDCSFRKRMEKLSCPVNFFSTYDSLPSFLTSTLFGKSIRKIGSAIERQAPDFVVDTGSVWADLLYRRRASRHIKWARIIHDATPHEDSQKLANFVRLVIPLAADVMIGVSDFSAGQLRDLCPGRPVIASRVGIQHSFGEPDLDRVAASRKNFLFFGRVEKYKGIEVLIEAYGLARSVDPDLQLVIAGRGYISPVLKSRAEKLGIVLMNEFIPQEKIIDLVHAAGVLVLPYLAATQSGVTAIGLANGLPMIATIVGGLPEHVIDGRNGRLVPPADPAKFAAALIEVSRSESLARGMAHESLELGKTKFAWKGIAADLLMDLAAIKYQEYRIAG